MGDEVRRKPSQFRWYVLQVGVIAAIVIWLKGAADEMGEPFNAYAAAMLGVLCAFILTLAILIVRGQFEHWSSVIAARRARSRSTSRQIAEPDSQRGRLRTSDRRFRELTEGSRRLRIGPIKADNVL